VDLVGLPQTLLLPTIALIVTQSAYVGFKAGLYGIGRIGAYARMEVLAGLTFFCALAMVVTGVSSALLAPFLLANAVFIAMAAWRLWRDGLGTAIDIADGSADTSSGNYAGVSMPRFVVIATIGAAAALARVHLAVLSTGASWPASEVGFLQAAMAFMAPVLLVPRAMELALFPALSRAFGRTDQSSFARQLGDIQALTSVALAMVAGALLIVGPALLPALLGPQFAAAQGALDGVIASAWLLGLAAPAIIALASAGSIAVPNVAGVLGLVASLIAWAWLVPSAGAGGAAAGLALGSLVTAAIPLAAAQFRYQHVAFSDLLLLVLSLGLLALALTVTRWGPAPPLAVAFLYMALVALLHRGRLVATAVAVRNAW
jgi:O-antigen/teichoic acid export membrane protein